MPTKYFPTEQEFKDTVERTFEKIVADRLPGLIRQATEKQVYTINEVCELLDVSRRHLLYLRQSGQINYVKMVRRYTSNMKICRNFLTGIT